MFKRLIPIPIPIHNHTTYHITYTMTSTSSDPSTISGSGQRPLFHGNVGPSLRTFTEAASAPAAHVRILNALSHDHRELESHSRHILTSTDPDEQNRYQNQFTWELARHAIGEELVVYPAIAKHVNDGQRIADKDRAEHQSIKEQLKAFQGLKPGDPAFLPTLRGMLDDLEHHFRQEEREELVWLEEALSQAESEALARSFERTKLFVPSRSHPMAPSKPPFETVVGLLAAPMDKVADIFRKWPHPGQLEKKGTK